MLELRGESDLALKAFATDRRREFGEQHFDRDFAVVLDVVGEVDRRQAAAAEFAIDVVAITDRGLQTREHLRRRGLGRRRAADARCARGRGAPVHKR